MDDSAWEDLKATWQDADVDELESARQYWLRKRRRRRMELVGEVLAVVGVLALNAYFLSRDPRPAMLVGAVFTSAFVLGSVGYSLWKRGRLSAELPTESRNFVRVLEVQHAFEKSMHRVGWYSIALVTLFCVGWAPWKLWVDWSMYVEEPWRAVVGFGGIVVILAGVVWWQRVTGGWLRQQASRLEAARKSFEGEPSQKA